MVPKELMSIVVVGSVNLDMFFRTDKLPDPGETVVATSVQKSYGGKGANQAVTVARLGGKAVMVCRVGQDSAGKELFDNFKSGVIRVLAHKPG